MSSGKDFDQSVSPKICLCLHRLWAQSLPNFFSYCAVLYYVVHQLFRVRRRSRVVVLVPVVLVPVVLVSVVLVSVILVSVVLVSASVVWSTSSSRSLVVGLFPLLSYRRRCLVALVLLFSACPVVLAEDYFEFFFLFKFWLKTSMTSEFTTN